ncbi:TPA: glycosyltransferase family 4 protein [Photobacterium damselae]
MEKNNYKILHFCSYYIGSKVYKELFQRFSKKNIEQIVYVPIRNKKDFNKNKVENIHIKYVKILSIFTRVFYSLKLFLIVLWSFFYFYKKKENISIVHAHTLYADGIPAYIFSRLFRKDLIITLRNTDVNLGFKYFIQYKWLAKLALEYCNEIIFVSYAHKSIFNDYFGYEYDSKINIIPNGLSDDYINNALIKKINHPKNKVGIYVGCSDKNKNIKNALDAFFDATDNNSKFYIVGVEQEEYIRIYGDICNSYIDRVIFFGNLSSIEIMHKMDQASIFIMPSYFETFGLVYLEAISRCLPIIYTQGQGFDGAIQSINIGDKCNPHDIRDISIKIRNVLNMYPNGLIFDGKNIVTTFSWEEIAINYIEKIYKVNA